MEKTKWLVIRAIALIVIVMNGFLPGFGQSSAELFEMGMAKTEQGYNNKDMALYEEGLKLMEKAYKKGNTRADWCYEIGWRYSCFIQIDGHLICCDRDKGLKWFKEGAKLGDLKSALVLYEEFKPRSSPQSIWAPDREWKKYFKARDKSWEYAGIALKAEIPGDFKDYMLLADAASYTNNEDLANRYAARAADNGEFMSIENLIKDERALEYLTSPKAMFEAAGKMWWERKSEEYGHHDKLNGFIWFEKAAKLGYPLAQRQMGKIYLRGLTVEPDTLRAVSWYKLAAKNNDPEALLQLGSLYINGKGVERDMEQGFDFICQSAENENIRLPKLFLGYCYLYGLGTDSDTQRARNLFQTYFDSFNHAPEQRLITVDGRLIDMDYLIGLTYYFEGSSECIPLFEASMEYDTFVGAQRCDLLRKLASCYRDGIGGTPVNIQKAEKLFDKSREFGKSEISRENIAI